MRQLRRRFTAVRLLEQQDATGNEVLLDDGDQLLEEQLSRRRRVDEPLHEKNVRRLVIDRARRRGREGRRGSGSRRIRPVPDLVHASEIGAGPQPREEIGRVIEVHLRLGRLARSRVEVAHLELAEADLVRVRDRRKDRDRLRDLLLCLGVPASHDVQSAAQALGEPRAAQLREVGLERAARQLDVLLGLLVAPLGDVELGEQQVRRGHAAQVLDRRREVERLAQRLERLRRVLRAVVDDAEHAQRIGLSPPVVDLSEQLERLDDLLLGEIVAPLPERDLAHRHERVRHAARVADLLRQRERAVERFERAIPLAREAEVVAEVRVRLGQKGSVAAALEVEDRALEILRRRVALAAVGVNPRHAEVHEDEAEQVVVPAPLGELARALPEVRRLDDVALVELDVAEPQIDLRQKVVVRRVALEVDGALEVVARHARLVDLHVGAAERVVPLGEPLVVLRLAVDLDRLVEPRDGARVVAQPAIDPPEPQLDERANARRQAREHGRLVVPADRVERLVEAREPFERLGEPAAEQRLGRGREAGLRQRLAEPFDRLAVVARVERDLPGVDERHDAAGRVALELTRRRRVGDRVGLDLGLGLRAILAQHGAHRHMADPRDDAARDGHVGELLRRPAVELVAEIARRLGRQLQDRALMLLAEARPRSFLRPAFELVEPRDPLLVEPADPLPDVGRIGGAGFGDVACVAPLPRHQDDSSAARPVFVAGSRPLLELRAFLEAQCPREYPLLHLKACIALTESGRGRVLK